MDPRKNGRSEGRWLILGVAKNQRVLAYLVTPQARLSSELDEFDFVDSIGVFNVLAVTGSQSRVSSREQLLNRLREIHESGWIPGNKLNSDGIAEPYRAQNGGGYTLEAALGIKPNGVAEPDYLGWEVKQFGVTRFPAIGTKPTTLMTPEPDGGIYTSKGAIEFVKCYGYPDKSGKPDRLNFGGKHIVDVKHKLTGLTLELTGFDTETNTITDAEGEIALVDSEGNVTASWGYTKIIDHWKRKHSRAVYIPCLKQKNLDTDLIEYHYGADIELGTGTSFHRLLTAMSSGIVFYDPGIKLEKVSSERPAIKRRSQFRVNHKGLNGLYDTFEFLNVLNVEKNQ